MFSYSRKRESEGFTAIESVVVVAVFSFLIAAISSSILYFYRANSYTVEQSYALNSARKGMETMVYEIRETAYSDTGAYPVALAADNSFEFYSDVDRDASVERIRYFLDGSNLKRGELQSSGNPPAYNPANEIINILSESVRNDISQPVFKYYDRDGNLIEDLSEVADICLIKIHLIVNVIEGRAPEEFTLYSTVSLRNLKTNL